VRSGSAKPTIAEKVGLRCKNRLRILDKFGWFLVWSGSVIRHPRWHTREKIELLCHGPYPNPSERQKVLIVYKYLLSFCQFIDLRLSLCLYTFALSSI
jgi:hypothetical protein